MMEPLKEHARSVATRAAVVRRSFALKYSIVVVRLQGNRRQHHSSLGLENYDDLRPEINEEGVDLLMMELVETVLENEL